MSEVTYQDAIDGVIDYLGGNLVDTVQRDARRAVLEAYRDFSNAQRWSYLLTIGRVVTSGPYDSGQVTYDPTTNQAVLSGTEDDLVTPASWPAWILGNFLRVGWQAWKVVKVIDPQTAVLDEQLNPGMATGPAAYVAYRDTYVLPPDFIGGDQALYEQNFGGMAYVHPREWLFQKRYIYSEGTPQLFTITGDQCFPSRLVMRFSPYPVEARTIDFLYHRRPRPLVIDTEQTGKVQGLHGETLLTGTGTAWDASMIGSVIRISSSTKAPSSAVGGFQGYNPPLLETRIADVPGATALDLADPLPQDVTGVSYTISDPVDFEPGAMLNAYFRCCEFHVSLNRTLKDKPSARAAYNTALGEARAADARCFTGRRVGDPPIHRQRLRDMPFTWEPG
jgi:hypothetical protein